MNNPDAAFRFNPAKPATARVYNYATGGKDNYAVDRDLADEIISLEPGAEQVAPENRDFIRRALWHVARQGVRQFLDIGPGMPHPAWATHQIALGNHAAARCAYIDKDPLVVTHWVGNTDMHPQVTAMHGDLACPRDIMDSPRLAECIDFSRPVAVILGAVLHFLPGPDAFDATECIKRDLADGSYLIISHATADGTSQGFARAVQDRYARCLDPLTFRTRAEVRRFFDGWELVPPGVVSVSEWQATGKAGTPAAVYAGVAFKRPTRRPHAVDFLV